MDEEIRVKACLAVVRDHRIVLVLKENKETGEDSWSLPGGRVYFGDSIDAVALNGFKTGTGFEAEITGVLDVNENILTNKPYHSLTITFYGNITNPELIKDEEKARSTSRWFSFEELKDVTYYPEQAIHKALGIDPS